MSNIWKTLGSSATGDKLIEKLKEVQDEACDCRNWDEETEKQHAQYASKVIEDEIIKPIQKNNPKKQTNRDPKRDQHV